MSSRFARRGALQGVVGALALGLTAWAFAPPLDAGTTQPSGEAQPPALALGREALARMRGCFIVDYNFHETRALAPGYTRDERVYDANRDKTVMEWVYPVESGRGVRLQHVLFALDAQGRLVERSLLRHQAEDWEYAPTSLFEYQGASHWTKKDVEQPEGKWVRRVTNLDGGLRYQCVGSWEQRGHRLEWQCGDTYAPIPGRETRDMQRSDYQALVRRTHLVVFPGSWLEKQQNVKTVETGAERTPLAEEVGRTWYVRVPDEECAAAARFAAERQAFWNLLQHTWDEVFAQTGAFVEVTPPGAPPRFVRVDAVEERFFTQVANDEKARAAARQELLDVIDAYRAQ
jgi:hypothetical protein